MHINKLFIFVFLASALALTGCVPETFQYDREIGSAGSGNGQFMGGTDMDITKDGYLVVADAGNSRFQIINPDNGSVVLTGGNDTASSARFKIKSMTGIGVDRIGGHIWVCDKQAGKLVRFNGQSGDADKAITKGLKRPMDVAVDKSGDLYVLMSKDSHIYKFDGTNGKLLEKFGGEGPASLVFGTSIAYSPDYKYFYITDYGGKRVIKVNASNGEFISDIKSKGEHEALVGPTCLYVDEDENIYLLDLGDIPVVLLNKKGNVISRIGTVGDGKIEGQMIYPSGIVSKNKNQIYVLDNSKNKIIAFKKKAQS